MNRKIDDYTFTVIKDQKKNIIGIVVRFKNEKAVFIPLIDIILIMEKII